MTCNPSWEEIKSELLAGQTPQDRPDLLTRVFRAKLEQLKEDIIENGVLGSVVAYAYRVSETWSSTCAYGGGGVR